MFTEILMPPRMGLSAMDLARSEGEPGQRARMELNWGCCHRQGDVRGWVRSGPGSSAEIPPKIQPLKAAVGFLQAKGPLPFPVSALSPPPWLSLQVTTSLMSLPREIPSFLRKRRGKSWHLALAVFGKNL